MHHPGDDRGGAPRSRARRRQLAAAARATRDQRLAFLVRSYPVDFDPTRQDRLRPTAEFVGYRSSRTVVSISSRPASLQIALDQFQLVCRTLAALDVHSVALVAGDELALTVSASADHQSDLSPFVIGPAFGPAGLGQPERLFLPA